ncbi:MAG: ABC transporter ATP-binding protein [Deltaproteobacteria bacterium]|jgi:branched-chain amino acid transport system ATP-binding protein|nr:ABC transporter ATP-binding protein [Deltaproteobacteria bacterium]
MSANPTNALDVKGLTMRFGGVTAIDDLTIEVAEGQITGLIGPNGAGKTTVFNVMTGFYQPQAGEVLLGTRKLNGLAPQAICALGLARTFQNIRLFDQGTVLENVMVGCHVRRKCSWWMAPLAWPPFFKEEKAIRLKSQALLERLNLGGVSGEKASSLPYGAQRRLEIARALATEPTILLLDEPAAGMNPQESSELMVFIENVRKEFDLSILLIEHDMKVVMGVCSMIWVMEYGRLIASGNPSEIKNNPKVISAYLGHQESEDSEDPQGSSSSDPQGSSSGGPQGPGADNSQGTASDA